MLTWETFYITVIAITESQAFKSSFLFENYDPISLTTAASGACIAVTCNSASAPCFNVNYTTALTSVNPNCESGEYCIIDPNTFVAVCAPPNPLTQVNELYPGDSCNILDYNDLCTYGTQTCNNEECQGIDLGGQCVESQDCYPNLYCNMGICSNPISIGSSCNFDNQCGRKGACYFKSSSSFSGVCTALFSIPDNYFLNLVQTSSNSVPIGEKTNLKTNIIGNSEFIPLLCQSEYFDNTGRCTSGTISLNKGQPCNTDADCPTSDSSVNASCKCGFNPTGQKYCDIMPGDTEWLDARAKFQTYYDATPNCGISTRWAECGQPASYYSWYCFTNLSQIKGSVPKLRPNTLYTQSETVSFNAQMK